MASEARDDFPTDVKRAIGQRVNYRCSNPTCSAPTSGPQVDTEKALNVGVAAHITAASPGGPRYNARLGEEERRSSRNGIWLCQTCAKLVDNDALRFTERLLRHWKLVAEEQALERIGKPSPLDRLSAPRLEVLKIPESAGSAMVQRVDEELLEQLSPLVTKNIVGIQRTILLGSGRGALGQSYAILGLDMKTGYDWKVLLFTAGEFGWDLVAEMNLDRQKTWVPEVLYVSGVPGALALTHVDGYGSGVFRRSTSWYRIAKGEPIPLLSYPQTFYVVGWGMPYDRFLTSRLLSAPMILQSGASLEIEFTVRYAMTGEYPAESAESTLFSAIHHLSMEWDDSAQIFVPRASTDDFSIIDEIWAEGTEGFTRRNKEQLAHLARFGTERQRHFIEQQLLTVL